MSPHFFYWFFRLDPIMFYISPLMVTLLGLIIAFVILIISSDNVFREIKKCEDRVHNSNRTNNEELIIKHYCEKCKGKISVKESSKFSNFQASCK